MRFGFLFFFAIVCLSFCCYWLLILLQLVSDDDISSAAVNFFWCVLWCCNLVFQFTTSVIDIFFWSIHIVLYLLQGYLLFYDFMVFCLAISSLFLFLIRWNNISYVLYSMKSSFILPFKKNTVGIYHNLQEKKKDLLRFIYDECSISHHLKVKFKWYIYMKNSRKQYFKFLCSSGVQHACMDFFSVKPYAISNNIDMVLIFLWEHFTYNFFFYYNFANF